MSGGYVSGRKFITDSEYHAAIDDAALVDEIKQKTDFENPESVERLYAAMQSGEFRFKTVIGRDFDDEVYELVRQYRELEIEPETLGEKVKRLSPFSFSTNSDKAVQTRRSRNNTSTVGRPQRHSQRNNATPEDIDAVAYQILQRKNIRRRAAIIALSLIAAASLGYFAVYSKSARDAQEAYDALASLKGTAPVAEQVEQKPLYTLAEYETPPEILDDYKNIYLKNRSVVGWLTIEDTNIDYPVMQTVNNEYYLTHNFEGNEDRNGALFVDSSCNIAFRSTNIIIYGHHMKSGKMFGNLKKYRSEDYCKEHNIIYFDSIYEKGIYEVMYVFTDHIRDAEDVSFKYYQFFNATSAEEFYSNMEAMADMSFYDTGVSAEYGDDILTLSTCSGNTETERFVVVAKRIGGENVSKTYNYEAPVAE